MEKLEERTLMAADLLIQGTDRNDRIEIAQVGDQVSVLQNGKTTVYDGVSSITVNALGGNDYVVNRTNLQSNLSGGAGHDYLQGGTGNDLLRGEAGNDILTDFTNGGGSNVLDGGDGNDNLWGGPGAADTLLGGNGSDIIYDIVGGTNTIDGGNGKDRIITRQTDLVVLNKYDNLSLFGPRPPVSLENGILYLTGDANNNQIKVEEVRGTIYVTFDNVVTKIRKSAVTMISGLGGDGDDVFVNKTSINSIFYGTGGNDTLIGGTGSDILKGGSGTDTLIGGGGKDDLSGDADADILTATKSILRADALDILFAEGNFLILN